jgi:hypothetical protein
MSAIPPKADIAKHGWDVCFVPIADMTRLFDHLTGQPVDLDQCTGEWPGRQLQKMGGVQRYENNLISSTVLQM